MAPDRGEKVGQRQTGAASLHDHVLRFFFEHQALRGATCASPLGNNGTDARPDDKQAALGERRHDLVCGVGIDFQLLAQRSYGRKRVAGSKFATDRGSRDRVDHLFRDRRARAEGN